MVMPLENKPPEPNLVLGGPVSSDNLPQNSYLTSYPDCDEGSHAIGSISVDAETWIVCESNTGSELRGSVTPKLAESRKDSFGARMVL